jgi:SAM-dependent methyltransferase
MKIGNVDLILDFMDNRHQYSDGDIEDEMLSAVQSDDFDAESLIKQDCRWPILYHFSPDRENLLEWYPFSNKGTGLEIGAGCGALTGLLCDKLHHVTAIELSYRRALIIANRHRVRENLKVIVGNLNDIHFEQKYDYVTLIGVLEYAGRYTNDGNPYLAFLEKVGGLLKEQGTLLLAIENKFGLKYWSGSREDHTGRLFDGLEDYPEFPINAIRTFSKKELEILLGKAGFTSLKFYYPFPDYKLPIYIFSDDFVPTRGLQNQFVDSYDQERLLLYDEDKVLQNIIQDGQFGFFANSFLVVCQKGGEIDELGLR